MGPRDQLYSYLATLASLTVIVLGSMVIAAHTPAILNKIEVFALGTVFGGLIGALRAPGARSVSIDNPPSNPVPTTEADSAK